MCAQAHLRRLTPFFSCFHHSPQMSFDFILLSPTKIINFSLFFRSHIFEGVWSNFCLALWPFLKLSILLILSTSLLKLDSPLAPIMFSMNQFEAVHDCKMQNSQGQWSPGGPKKEDKLVGRFSVFSSEIGFGLENVTTNVVSSLRFCIFSDFCCVYFTSYLFPFMLADLILRVSNVWIDRRRYITRLRRYMKLNNNIQLRLVRFLQLTVLTRYWELEIDDRYWGLRNWSAVVKAD